MSSSQLGGIAKTLSTTVTLYLGYTRNEWEHAPFHDLTVHQAVQNKETVLCHRTQSILCMKTKQTVWKRVFFNCRQSLLDSVKAYDKVSLMCCAKKLHVRQKKKKVFQVFKYWLFFHKKEHGMLRKRQHPSGFLCHAYLLPPAVLPLSLSDSLILQRTHSPSEHVQVASISLILAYGTNLNFDPFLPKFLPNSNLRGIRVAG